MNLNIFIEWKLVAVQKDIRAHLVSLAPQASIETQTTTVCARSAPAKDVLATTMSKAAI